MRISGIKRAIVLSAVSALVLAGVAQAQQPNQENVARLARQIQKKILTLSNYGVFDYITFGIKPGENGYVVILRGYASRPSLKKSAERVASKLEQVGAVENEIEALPTSRMDEDLRMAVYAKVYYHPSLSRYNPNRGTPVYGGAYGFRRAAQLGISNDPPQGYHPISIIVKNGNVTLEGVIDTDADKQIAGMQANSTAGVFSVTSNLHVLNPSKSKKKKG